MGNFASARLAAFVLAFTLFATAEGATDLPRTIGYTFFVGGRRVGQSETRVVQSPTVLRFESNLRVETGPDVTELTTHTEASPETYAVRHFSFQGTKGRQPRSASVTIDGDSVFGTTSIGGSERKRGRRLKTTPIVVWEDWVMEIEILLALQQARASKNVSTLDFMLASSFSMSSLTLGYTGEAAVEGKERSTVTRKLLVAFQGGDPFESFVDPKSGIPIYIRFPGLQAEAFLNEFFGDNPVSAYPPKPTAPSDP